ncbi:hypothetical protein A2853_04060 [Candidatus Kaiserbacteria bacterium RIFCSPHIGHO2_01_FULL_55_17]|uniref:Uncharacterized protein n=1 Tax=Candidatus Kaiserbacteria bacterium RIFCSPHIGHO2_01_FULL_55_17 TaxID=1798484 RepID=A0A1F6D7Y9_9BACT|nr:MAG: hypothetical protein A2853_04060 [Candidatus Kaiserbacteria bacterium RIFCSPHIGHO2_01_FULL_55_17]
MKPFFIAIGAVVILVLAGAFVLPQPGGTGRTDPDVIADAGMHWHPMLEMYVKGEKIEIPQNIGIGAVHQPMHTHDDLPIIHLEFPGMVRTQDILLGRFFDIWGKDMGSFGTNMMMTVNGKENTEYGNYMMRDGDKIALRYE